MLADDPGQLEHGGLIFAKNGLQLAVGFDGALVSRALHVVGLDVVPNFFDHLGAGTSAVANHGHQGRAGFEGAHGGFARGFFGCGSGQWIWALIRTRLIGTVFFQMCVIGI